jgi:hypothetical protein
VNKRTMGAVLAATAVAAIAPFTFSELNSAGATGVQHQQDQPGAVTIQSWVYAVPSENVLSGTLWGCTRISGAIVDQSGGPTWANQSQYEAPTHVQGAAAITAASHECADKVPVGGFVHVPPPYPGQYQFAKYTATPNSTYAQSTGLTSLYSDQTISGQKGDIFITIASAYNMTDNPVLVGTTEVQPFTTGPGATWVITGGTGAYAGLQGDGTWFGDAAMFPWIYRPGTGRVWWTATP